MERGEGVSLLLLSVATPASGPAMASTTRVATLSWGKEKGEKKKGEKRKKKKEGDSEGQPKWLHPLISSSQCPTLFPGHRKRREEEKKKRGRTLSRSGSNKLIVLCSFSSSLACPGRRKRKRGKEKEKKKKGDRKA